MRQERTVQATIFEVFARHEIGCELKTISQWLDRQLALVSLVAGDLRRHGLHETGRRGLPAETVLRCALLKQQRQLSYEELAFHLEDSVSNSTLRAHQRFTNSTTSILLLRDDRCSQRFYTAWPLYRPCEWDW